MGEALTRAQLAALVERGKALERAIKAREEADRVEALRTGAHAATRSLAAFVRLLWRVVEPAPLEWGWHMQAVCDALQDVAEGRCRRLIINVPPGFSKSLLTSVFFPAWKWLRDPSDRSLYLSHSADLARRDSRRTRILLQSPEYAVVKAAAGQSWTFAKDQNEATNFENTERGFRYCASLGSGLTGKRGDNVVIDDPHDAKEAIEGAPERIAERMAETASNFDQVVISRLNDPRSGSIIVIMQRLHEIDLTGHLLAQGGWRTLVLPMRYDPDRCDPADPRREPGALLDPRRFPEAVVARLYASLGHQASGQLDQRPVPKGGGMFPPDGWLWLDRSAWPTRFAREAAGWDLAFGGSESGAYHAGVFGGALDGRVYLSGELHVRCEADALLEHMREVQRRHPKATAWHVEDRAAARPVVAMLRREMAAAGVSLVLRQPDGDKVARAQRWQPVHAAGRIVLPCRCGRRELHAHPDLQSCPGEPWAVELAREHESFPKGAYKDRPDAMGYLVPELAGLNASSAYTASPGGYTAPSQWG